MSSCKGCCWRLRGFRENMKINRRMAMGYRLGLRLASRIRVKARLASLSRVMARIVQGRNTAKQTNLPTDANKAAYQIAARGLVR